MQKTLPVKEEEGLKSFHLIYVSLSDNKDKLAVHLHHSAVLQDTLHLRGNLLAPGGVRGLWDPRTQHLLPQQPVLCMRKEEKVMQKEVGLIC